MLDAEADIGVFKTQPEGGNDLWGDTGLMALDICGTRSLVITMTASRRPRASNFKLVMSSFPACRTTPLLRRL
jgi:hypothetical protein